MHNSLITKHLTDPDSCLKSGAKVAPNLLAQVQQFLNPLAEQSPNKPTTIIVGFSGGLDSTVLLHLLHCLLHSPTNIQSSAQSKIKLKAVHVNHGISQNACEWSRHCQWLCEKLNIDLSIKKVTLENSQRQGLEAVARKKRYAAFTQSMQLEINKNQHVTLVTGHHLRDQAETVLHNLTRGAGVNGLAAMPLCKPIVVDGNTESNLKHCRPMLNVHYKELTDYADAYDLTFVVDESNHDTSLKRNMIRHEVLPCLEKHWPNTQASLARTAEHMQEALVLLDELAEDCLLDMPQYGSFYLELNSDWSMVKQKNLLRYWLKQYFADIVLSGKHYEWVLNALANIHSSNNSNHCYHLKNAEIRVYKNRVYILKNEPQSFRFNFESLSSLQYFLDEKAKLNDAGKLNGSKRYLFKINEIDCKSNISLMTYDNLTEENKIQLKKKKMKSFYQLESIPAWERTKWPFLVFNHNVLMLGCPQCCNNDLMKKPINIAISLEQRYSLISK